MKRTIVIANNMIEARSYCAGRGLNWNGPEVVLLTPTRLPRGLAITPGDELVDVSRPREMGQAMLERHDMLMSEIYRARIRGGSA